MKPLILSLGGDSHGQAHSHPGMTVVLTALPFTGSLPDYNSAVNLHELLADGSIVFINALRHSIALQSDRIKVGLLYRDCIFTVIV